jgi:hydrogenase maturation factor HypF (carbamoyltransferase family)
MISYFDQMLHTFNCENPQCGHCFQEPLRSLLYADEISCPKCRTKIDIRASKSSGQLGKDFDTAVELDKKHEDKNRAKNN